MALFSAQHAWLIKKKEHMLSFAKDTKVTIIPVLRYRDAGAAVAWLCRVFGFEKHLVVASAEGGIAHAQLSFGNGMIMLASVPKSATVFDRLIKQPHELGGTQTQITYVVVTDVDALYSAVKAGGAKIATEITYEDDGGRDFSCYDLEDHLWSFGRHDPWETQGLRVGAV
jgi:uncharacterized glyoxalase superfamily protein PhnB